MVNSVERIDSHFKMGWRPTGIAPVTSSRTLRDLKLHGGCGKLWDPGYQYIAEANDLRMIESGTYHFVLSSHTIEHTAKPLRALREAR